MRSDAELIRAARTDAEAFSELYAATDAALRGAFAGDRCPGLEHAGEQARLVYAGVEPRTLLMPGAR